MNKNQLLIPSLRFKGFNEEWEKIILKNNLIINPRNNNKLPNTFLYIDLESVDKGKIIKKNIISYKFAPSRAKRVVEINDILFQSVRPYQKNNLFYDKKYFDNTIASTGYIQIRTINDNAHFFYFLFHTNRFTNNVLEKCKGSSYPSIDSANFSSITTYYTKNILEQQKIAKFFSLLDKQIELYEKKLNNYDLIYKHYLNKMFANNNKIPSFRFKGFDDELINKKIKEFGNIICGKTPSTNENKFWNGDIPFITPTDVGVINKL